MTTATTTALPERLPLGRDSLAWRVNSEPLVFTGGGRALLMQVAHPGVGAGVEQHSSYASDPWGRFFRTVDVMMKLSFGSEEDSARQARLLDKMHRRVTGTTDFGEPYTAHDTDLQVWVWATLVDTALIVYELMQPKLTPSERERFYQESKLVAYGCGVPAGACPETWDDFVTYIDRVVAEDLTVTRSARAVATAAMVPPLPLGLDRLTATPNQLMTVGLMTPSLRAQYGFAWDDGRQRRLERFVRNARVASRAVPATIRRLPARSAIRQRRPLRVPWLQRRGAELTDARLTEAGFGS